MANYDVSQQRRMHTLLCLCTRGEKKKGTADCKGEGGIEVERDGEIN